ncbi:type II toxin-antitoxin system VapC family toxin [Sphingobacterium pedocola]|uniref:type II toxin-antitoxin system VapC family toxin n=1 Tax=Sphingobacterium pedocola TaxID=2082722 RepID=UPI001E51A80C|nr:type II toxin-antitoxin system VapC family toxin [Sphingobacterium pedocola]
MDTNIVIELFKGNPTIMTNLGNRQQVDIPYVVLGELLLGAYRSSHVEKHLSQVNAFLKKCNIIGADAETANAYAIIKTELLKKGKPIPENDIWIAAIATQHRLTLITRDAHFKEVVPLSTEKW